MDKEAQSLKGQPTQHNQGLQKAEIGTAEHAGIPKATLQQMMGDKLENKINQQAHPTTSVVTREDTKNWEVINNS